MHSPLDWNLESCTCLACGPSADLYSRRIAGHETYLEHVEYPMISASVPGIRYLLTQKTQDLVTWKRGGITDNRDPQVQMQRHVKYQNEPLIHPALGLTTLTYIL